jgi:hypothetical protein
MTVRPLRRVCSVLLLPLVLGALVGCAGGKNQVPVKGKVTLNGTPLASGSVSYHPDEAKGTRSQVLAVGPINEQGEYALSASNKEGCPPGHYKVTVNAGVPSDPKNQYSLPKSIIHRKFADPRTTPLSIEVKPDAAAGAYDLVVSK